MGQSLKLLYLQAAAEERQPMRPSSAARQSGMSPRTVFRYLQDGKVLTPSGFVPFKRDSGGLISLVRLQCIKTLRDHLPRPGRKYGKRFRLRRGRNANDRIGSTAKKKDNAWRLQRILAMIERIDDKDDIQTIRASAALKYHRL